MESDSWPKYHTDFVPTRSNKIRAVESKASRVSYCEPKKLSSNFISKIQREMVWTNYRATHKPNLVDHVMNYIESQDGADLKVHIGDYTYFCHTVVMQCYSMYMRHFAGPMILSFPSDVIAPKIFEELYEWVLDPEPPFIYRNVLDLFTAASYFEMNDLCEDCWFYMNRAECYNEDTAFELYMLARKKKMRDVQVLTLPKISRIFLTLVACREFRELRSDEVCTLLSSNYIAVNSEAEVFFAAIIWLSHNWSARTKYLMKLMKCIRFALMPPCFLSTLCTSHENFGLERALTPEVKVLIRDAMCFIAMHRFYSHNSDEYLEYALSQNQIEPSPRTWIVDKKCPYHVPISDGFFYEITFDSFVKYLNSLQEFGRNHWRTLNSHV